MSLTRTQMSPDEATQLASLIDQSHLPVHVKRVTQEGVVEIQDDNTGYVLPILSEQHWKQYARQQGDSNAIDEFANAGLVLLSKLDDILSQMKAERESLLAQAEQIDAQVTRYQTKRDAIGAAINAADAISLLATVKGVTVTPPTTRPRGKRIHAHPNSDGTTTTQLGWIRERMQAAVEPVKVADLASDWSIIANTSRAASVKSISSTLSRLVKEDNRYVRMAQGVYQFFPETVQVKG